MKLNAMMTLCFPLITFCYHKVWAFASKCPTIMKCPNYFYFFSSQIPKQQRYIYTAVMQIMKVHYIRSKQIQILQQLKSTYARKATYKPRNLSQSKVEHILKRPSKVRMVLLLIECYTFVPLVVFCRECSYRIALRASNICNPHHNSSRAANMNHIYLSNTHINSHLYRFTPCIVRSDIQARQLHH